MQIKNVDFVKSCPNISECPKSDLPEIAVVGRSNVGKSSFINMLLNNKKISKVSSTPGKTQFLNYFLVNYKWFLVDLPGYGYAKVSKQLRKNWSKMIQGYLMNRKELECIFVLIDCRLPPQEIDIEFLYWLGLNKLPMCIVFTKIDKVKKDTLMRNIETFNEKILERFEFLPNILQVSAVTKSGKTETLDYINKVIY